MKPRTKCWRNHCNLENLGNLGCSSSRSIQLISCSEDSSIRAFAPERIPNLHYYAEFSARAPWKTHQSVGSNSAAIHRKYRRSISSASFYFTYLGTKISLTLSLSISQFQFFLFSLSLSCLLLLPYLYLFNIFEKTAFTILLKWKISVILRNIFLAISERWWTGLFILHHLWLPPRISPSLEFRRN